MAWCQLNVQEHLAPAIRKILLELEEALQGEEEFNEQNSQRVFRIMASDYAASTLLPKLLKRIKSNCSQRNYRYYDPK